MSTTEGRLYAFLFCCLVAAESYGLKGAVSLRVIQNVFGVVFALAFCAVFYWFMSKQKESDVTVHAE